MSWRRWAAIIGGVVGALALPASASAATVAISSTSGSPTASVTLTASGFDPSASLDVYFDTTQIAIATTDAAGNATIGATVPASAQPGKHWFTLDERHANVAAQVAWTEQTNWITDGYGPSQRGFNPFENTLNTSNVGGLRLAWSASTGNIFANYDGVIRYAGRLFVYSANDSKLRAFNSSGTLQWTGAVGFSNGTPAASGNVVVFTSQSGTTAFSATCRSDGGACTPLWSNATGSYGTVSPTIANGVVYVPGADNVVHTFALTTGAAGPTYAGGTGATNAETAVAVGTHGDLYWSDYTQRLDYVNAGPAGNQTGATPAYAGDVTAPVVFNNRAYFSTSDGGVHQLFGWDTASGTSLNDTAGVGAAHSKIFAGNNSSFAAYDAGDGTQLWVNTRTATQYAPAIANGLVYVCAATSVFPAHSALVALDASTGDRLWTGGPCNGRPIVVDGTVSVPDVGFLETYSLSPANAASRRGHALRHAPDPRRLHPSARFVRRATHHHA